jgi:hypothetical protein
VKGMNWSSPGKPEVAFAVGGQARLRRQPASERALYPDNDSDFDGVTHLSTRILIDRGDIA